MKRIRKAVFPVGGLGTRFLPATKAMPKEMLTVVDKPLIQYAVEEAKAAGIEEFIFVTGRGKTAIEDHFDRSIELELTLSGRGHDKQLKELMNILPIEGTAMYTRQQEPLGLGHAVWCARHLVGDEPFAVLSADEMILGQTPCLKQLMDIYDQQGGNVVAVMDVPADQTNKYGIVETKDSGNLVSINGMVEKPEINKAPSTLAIIGRYILQPQIFDHLEKKERGVGNEIQLTDAMIKMIGEKPFHGLRVEGKRYDCGSKMGFLMAIVDNALNRDDLKDEFLEELQKAIMDKGRKCA